MNNGFDQPAFNMSQFSQPRQDVSNQMTQEQKKKPWWTSLISELGGAGGAASGAAIGTALLPGVGTVLGAGLGGLIGGTSGRIAENKVRDNRVGLGDAIKEGGIDALLSGAGEGYQAFKAGKAAIGLDDAAKGVEGAIQAPEKVGFLQSVGRNIKAGAGGFGIGAKVPGEQQLTASASDEIGNTLKKLGVPNSSPETQARTLGEKIQNIGNILTQRYAKANVSLAPEEVNNLGANILQRVTNTAGLGKDAQNFALEEAQKLAKTNDVNGVWQYAKDLARNSTNFGASGDAKLADKEAASRIILDETRGFLNGKVPGAADANNLFHNAKTAEKFVLGAAKDRTGGGLISKVASLSPVKAAESKVGGLLETVGRGTAGTAEGAITGPASQVFNQTLTQAPGALFKGTTQPQDSSLQTGQDQTGSPSDLLGMGQSDSSQGSNDLLGLGSNGPSADTLQKALQADLIATGGKNSDLLTKMAQLQGVGSLSTADQTRSDALQTAMSALDGAEQNLVSSGGAKGPLLGGLSTLPVVGSLLDPAGASYHTTKIELATQLAKAITGGSRPAQSVIDKYLHSLPDVNDTPQFAQAKLDKLRSELSTQAKSFGFSDLLNQSQGSPQALLSQLSGQ